MRVISIINQKGGCGKTTTAINLASGLARLQKRVLVIDLDPQGHASLGLNLSPEKLSKGMTEVLIQGACLDDVICVSVNPGLDVAPANITLSATEPLLSTAHQKEKRLQGAIEGLSRKYDFIIIDSPPSLGILTFNALQAGNEAIVPLEMSFFSMHGLAKLTEIVDVLARHTGHKIKVRALATMANLRTRFAQEIMAEIQDHFGERAFKTVIRNNVRLREAASHGQPIHEYDPTANGSQDYMALARETLGMELVVLGGITVPRKESQLPAVRPEKFLGPIVVEDVLPDQPGSAMESGARG